MPFALLAIGLLLVIAAYNNTQTVLAAQLKKDFSGNTGFIMWIAAILIVGAIGYIRPLQTVSRAFLGLILVVIFLTNAGFFSQFNAALSGAAGGTTGKGDGSGDKTGAGSSESNGPLIIGVGPNYGTAAPTYH